MPLAFFEEQGFCQFENEMIRGGVVRWKQCAPQNKKQRQSLSFAAV